MAKSVRLFAVLSVCLALSGAAWAEIVHTYPGIPPWTSYTVETHDYFAPGDSDENGTYVDLAGSYNTWWHSGPAAGDYVPNVKNHQVGQFTETVAPTALVNSYGRKLTAEEINALGTTPVPYADIFGTYSLGPYQDLSGATDHYFPPETAGKPIDFIGTHEASGVRFTDVADEMLVQFLSSDKNDGWIEVVVNDCVVMRLDTWCQGWWYFKLSGLDAETADTVELRTYWDETENISIPSPHINTLDLKSTSENWMHMLPGDEGYPLPDDFHIFFIAYNPVEVPEPATLVLLGAGVVAGAWMRRRKRRAR